MLQSIIDSELKLVSDIGDKNFILVIFVLVGALILFIFKYKKDSLFLLLSSFSFILSYILKFIFKEPRPVTAHVEFALDYYSFPSSHVMTYTAIFGYILYLSFKLKKLDKFFRYIMQATSIYFIGLIGVSRVYLGQHFPRDVFAGYIFGLIYLAGLILLDRKLNKSTTKNKN